MSGTLKIVLVILLIGLACPAAAYALNTDEQQDEESVHGFRSTDLPLPRFVSLRSDKVYVRAGPALRYPIKWIYRRAGMPVEIVQEFDSWRKVRGIDGEEGWVHQSLLSGERTVMTRSDKKSEDLIPMREGFSGDARLVARLEPMVVAGVDKCTNDWCRIDAGGYHGWVQRNFLWGIYEGEDLN